MRNLLRLLVVVVISLMPSVHSQGTYTITAPNTIRPNNPATVAVNFFSQGSASLTVNARISGEGYSSSQRATLRPGTNGILSLSIGSWRSGSYKLEVNGTGAVEFQRTTNLAFSNKEFSLLIETDKGIYQLTQRVNFRVVVVNSNLLPYPNQTVQVYITDAEQNRIKQWDTRLSNFGTFEGSLQLSDQPVQGQWNIFASVKGVSTSESFEVSEYVLPRFETFVEPPTYITASDTEFYIDLSARYTFGGLVSGTYLINVTETYCTYSYARCTSRPVVIRGQLSGNVKVLVNVADLNLRQQYTGGLTIFAVVTEEFTGIQQNDTTTLQIYQTAERLVIENADAYKPLLPFEITVKLQKQNNLPVTSASGVVNVTLTYTFEDSSPVERIAFLNLRQDGTASLTDVPPLLSSSLLIRVAYKDLTANSYVQAAQSLSDKYISIGVTANRPKVGDRIIVTVNATFRLEKAISYQVIGRGSILTSANVLLNAPSNSVAFTITLTRSMAPNVRIIVFFVSGCGEIVADALDLAVDGAIQTSLTLQLSNTTAEPGDNVRIRITSRPSTLVGLKSVDQSVLLLREGNDITKTEIYNELGQYDIGGRPIYTPLEPLIPGFIWRPPYGSGIVDLFQGIGLVLLTNALHYKAPICRYFGGVPLRLDLAKVSGGPAVEFAAGAPLAAEDAAGGGFVEPTRTRKNFPETWVWTNITTRSNGIADVTYQVPDTITTWVISGIAISRNYGLGVTDAPYNVTVFRPFFLVTNLPFSVIRTEIVTIQILVFNYLQENLDPVIVTLNRTGQIAEYDILEQTVTTAVLVQKNVTVRSNDVRAVTFRIRPKFVGSISLNLKAVSAYAGDALIASLRVKAEGSPQYFSNSTFIDLRNASRYTTTIRVLIPANAVPGSEFIEFSCARDILAPILANIKNLIQLPSGCGEQTLINFVPDVFILAYLTKSNSLTSDLESLLLNYLEQGYQNELRYKRNDGSFSAFGQSDKSGSTWLTAYVVKAFTHASSYITIDDNVILAAKRYLVRSQDGTGAFVENGAIIHKGLQGGSGSGVALTAFVVIAFLEDQNQNNTEFLTAINKAVSFLESRVDIIRSVYEIAIVTYALHLANSRLRNDAYIRLEALKTTDGDLAYWHFAVPKPSGSDWYYNGPSSYDVETTSYALLVYDRRGNTNYLPIVRWLIVNRNALGGYSSSQDTVIGIQALTTVAAKLTPPRGSSVLLTVVYLNLTSRFTLNDGNALVLQKEQLPKAVRLVSITATGNGVAIAGVSWNYNIVKNTTANPSFRLNLIFSTKNNKSYSLNVCSSYLLNDTTNMVLLEVNTLSGYNWDDSSIPEPGSLDGLKKVEKSQSNTLVVFYFDVLPAVPNQLCVSLTAIQITIVEELQPAIVSVYDYYESSKRAEAFYNLSGGSGGNGGSDDCCDDGCEDDGESTTAPPPRVC